MKRMNIFVGVCLSALLAACEGNSGPTPATPPIGPYAGVPHSSSSHSPRRILTGLGGLLYGTTTEGGLHGGGTVYSIALSGAVTVLHNFGAGDDGSYPAAGLTAVGGVLYGTTESGGTGAGTIFSITPSGAEAVLHEFAGGNAGATPVAGLTNVGGVLYGTTQQGGGPQNEGTIFKITTNGAYTQLHNFVGGGNDGAYPDAGLTNVNGVLYGTTFEGGGGVCPPNQTYRAGCGTIFKMEADGAYTQLHEFVGGGNDGAYPHAGLINVSGVLYGTTTFGGSSQSGGDGTVFKMQTDGAYTQLHNFVGGGNDGAFPQAGLADVGGMLYGTTEAGGGGVCPPYYSYYEGCGTVFKMETDGSYTQLHEFVGGGNDGAFPVAGLTNVDGVLYGTTVLGGSSQNAGEGTVFKMQTDGTYAQLHSFAGGNSDGAQPYAALLAPPPPLRVGPVETARSLRHR